MSYNEDYDDSINSDFESEDEPLDLPDEPLEESEYEEEDPDDKYH